MKKILEQLTALQVKMPVQTIILVLIIAFLLAMTWTCMTIKEKDSRVQHSDSNSDEQTKKSNFIDDLKEFFLLSPQV